jgi:hypothetical protein
VSGINSEQLVQACREIEQDLWGDQVPMRFADGALFTINDICSIHKYNVSPVRKDDLEAQVNSLRLALTNGKLEINPDCKNLIMQCATGIWNKQKTQFQREGHNHNDLIAALIYFVRHISKENPYPADYQFNRDTMHWRPRNAVPDHLKQIKETFGPKEEPDLVFNKQRSIVDILGRRR